MYRSSQSVHVSSIIRIPIRFHVARSDNQRNPIWSPYAEDSIQRRGFSFFFAILSIFQNSVIYQGEHTHHTPTTRTPFRSLLSSLFRIFRLGLLFFFFPPFSPFLLLIPLLTVLYSPVNHLPPTLFSHRSSFLERGKFPILFLLAIASFFFP